MKFTKEGEDLVSTPLYVGTTESLKEMSSCTHEWKEEKWTQQVGVYPQLGPGKKALVLQRCKCGATRCRLKKLEETNGGAT